MSTEAYRQRKREWERERAGIRQERTVTRPPRRRGLNPGALGRLLAEAEAAARTCSECGDPPVLGQIYLETLARQGQPTEYLCPGCADSKLTRRRRTDMVAP